MPTWGRSPSAKGPGDRPDLPDRGAGHLGVRADPDSSFGGDIVRIKAGPGGDFGKAVYAISRGAGGNTGAVNKPGVIYRVDPATGKASVFFDLNTVITSLSPPRTPPTRSALDRAGQLV